MLSGKELVIHASKLKSEKLLTIGSKLVQPLSEPSERLKEVEENFKEITSLEKVNRSDARLIGNYESNINRIRVAKVLGKSHRLIGKWEGGAYFLEPHEALFLMEMNELVVYFDEIILSIEHAYHLFLDNPSTFSTEKYIAYSHLMRSGFAVRKHQEDQTYEEKTLTEKDEILINLKKNLNSINQKDVEKYKISERVQQDFLDTRLDFLQSTYESDDEEEEEQDETKKESTSKKVKLEVPNFFIEPIDEFPESNPSDEFYEVFKQLKVVENFEVSGGPRLTLDFDLYPLEGGVNSSKFKEKPKYHAKVVKYDEELDNQEIKRMMMKAGGVKVLFVIIFENLSVSTYVCE